MNMFIFMTIMNACRVLLEFQGKISPDLRFLVFTFVLFTVRSAKSFCITKMISNNDLDLWL